MFICPHLGELMLNPKVTLESSQGCLTPSLTTDCRGAFICVKSIALKPSMCCISQTGICFLRSFNKEKEEKEEEDWDFHH